MNDADAEQMANARAFMSSLRTVAPWLNRLERLLTLVSESTAVVVAAAEGTPHEQAASDLAAALQAFTIELFGSDDGTSPLHAVDPGSGPLVPPDLMIAAATLSTITEAIAKAGGQLKIDGPVTDDQVRAFSDALYEVQAACERMDATT